MHRMSKVSEKENKRRGAVVNNLRSGGIPGCSNPSATREAVRGRKIFSSFLIEFFEANPWRRKKIMMKAIEYAEKGNARFLELIITLVEGPLKDKTETQNTYNFNFMSDGDRERALGSVARIKAMALDVAAAPQKLLTEASDGEPEHGNETGDGNSGEPGGR